VVDCAAERPSGPEVGSFIPVHRWRQFVADCTKFLASFESAERAAALSWDAVALRLNPLPLLIA